MDRIEEVATFTAYDDYYYLLLQPDDSALMGASMVRINDLCKERGYSLHTALALPDGRVLVLLDRSVKGD